MVRWYHLMLGSGSHRDRDSAPTSGRNEGKTTSGAMPVKSPSSNRDIVVPAATLTDLEGALREAGAGGVAFRVLRSTGRAAGEAAAPVVSGGEEPGSVGETLFWSRVGALVAKQGWGELEHSTPHPGVGLIDTGDWADAGPGSPFSEGLFSGLLSAVAGAEVTAIRVPSDDGVRFAYGAPETIRALQLHLADLGDLGSALEAL